MGGETARGRKPRGQHPDKRLTAVRIKALKTPGKYADGNGLYLLVEPSGAKRWMLRTIVLGKRSEIGLGGLSLVSLAEAREKAVTMRKQARAGADPLAERRRANAKVLTFKAAAKQVHAEHGKAFRNAKHRAQWLASLDADVFPVIGQRPVNVIEPADILKVLTPIWTVKPETARRLKQRIRVVLEWAKASGLRSGDNPVDGVARVLPRHTTSKEHHAAMGYPELPAFVKKVQDADGAEAVRLALEWTILTAARTNETIGARWDEIDRDAAVWTVPASRMKAGRPHRVPLSSRCLEILTRAEALKGDSSFVFPGRGGTKLLSNMALAMLMRRLKRTETVHGMRSAFRDWAAEQTDAPRAVCEAALAHTIQNKAEAAYARSDLFERRRTLMHAWSNYLTNG